MNSDFRKFDLYVQSFQNSEDLITLLESESQINGSLLGDLREDFCGTAANCVEWVRKVETREGVGVDVDPKPLQKAIQNCPGNLKDRIELICGDVLQIDLPKADIAIAMNCSFCVFKQRTEFSRYLEKCYASLRSPGMMVLEVYCGPAAQETGKDEIPIEGGVAIWEQVSFDPLTNQCLNKIHFRMDDGKFIEDAFVYDWRLWSPAECCDLLKEVGFADIKVQSYPDSDETEDDGRSKTVLIFGFKQS